ncbi:MAG TPA: FtsQ-type POTRA domain-containing protein [Bryobacteraceae bacterium]|jgi:cell division protein FtsQ|nr:FtsQ-type POTRA domain-containing protein [Bryobacteraceae bacterium]
MPKPLAPPKPKMNWRLWIRLVAWTGIVAGLAWGGREVNSFLLRDPRFQFACGNNEPSCANFEIRGAVYTSHARIQNVFAPDFGASVFSMPLAERRRRLLALDWVSSASISRVWPRGIVVTVKERTPVAFARLPIAGTARSRFSLIDSEGVLLSIPARVRFRLPILSGVTEAQTEANRSVRVQAMQHLLDDLGPQARDISEINAASTMDMRLITAIDGHAVELWIGDQHYRSRYRHFVESYEEIRQHSDQSSVFDLRLDDRILAK